MHNTGVRVFKAAVITALLAVLTILLVYAFTPLKCILDVINFFIHRQCTFAPFYAGTANTPPTASLIPALGDLEESWLQVRAELDGILRDRRQIPRMHDVYNIMYKGAGAGITKLLARAVYGADVFDRGVADWKTFNLITFGRAVPRNAERCPETVRLLRRIPGMQSAMFTVLAPGADSPTPGGSPASGVVRYHLALRAPGNCFINVAGEDYHWVEGEGVMFDDAFDHYVHADEERAILFVDILRPLRGTARLLQSIANALNYYSPASGASKV